MKRLYHVMMLVTLVLAVVSLSVSVTAGMNAASLRTASKAMIILALFGLSASVILHPKVKQAETVGGSDARVSDEMRSGLGFSDVAANDTAIRSLKELKDYLEAPEKYVKLGARMPRGILLYGPPGTGKTLMARALAGEAGVPFFAMSGSDFVEKYVGVGASRVRDLFKKARKAGRCVVFIDEIDAMGKKRHDQSSDERDQTLNALLSEMSGFYTGDGVLVIAATNRIEMLDPALLRPGRFDRQIEVGLPGKKERLGILKLHARNKPVSASVDLERIASQTTMFSGASLENLLNEAAINAAARNVAEIESKDIEKAYLRVVAGDDRESAAEKTEKCVIALHEAGHALASRLVTPEAKLVRVSILPAGHGMEGYNLCIPKERVTMNRKALEDQICILLAGRAAEVLMGGEDAMTAGASGDIARATEIASAMVTELGMAGDPAVSLKVLAGKCGNASDAGEKCRRILERQYERAFTLLGDNAGALVAITEALMDAETLSGEEVDALILSMSNESPESA